MSGYRNYVPWNKSSSTSYSGSAKTPSSVSIPKFEKNLGRNSTESIKTPTSRIASRYGTTYSAGVQQDISSPSTAGYNARCDNSRKKDTSHPPVSYRPLSRTGSRSRDPSPVDKSEKSASSSSSYDYNRLYPKTYQRSVSRERTESTGSSTTIPKYYGRNSSNEFEAAKYTGKSTITKDEIPRRLSVSKDETSPSSRYKIPSRTTSREDLSSGSQKYIKSRFLPKNSVEKSQTAYSKSSSAKTNEVSRRNRELLNALHVQQEQERLSRPTSRCSSVTPEECFVKQISSSSNSEGKSAPKRELEMEAVTMISRGTSPIQESIPGYLKTRRAEGAQIIEKKIVRPKKPVHTMVDKGIQSEKSEEPTRILRYTKPSTTSATPWSSFLDMKFSSPNSKQKSSIKSDNKAQISTKNSGSPDSSKSLSRSSSTKSLANVQSSQNDKPKDVKKSPSPSKSRIVPPKQIGDKKQLPPQIPKSESPSKSCHSTNKDFRKSVLNMNPTGKPNSKQLSRRSHSASSADSEVADPDATDVSENLTSCRSYHDSCSSKLPKKTTPEKARRSSSREASIASTTSGSEDDMQTRKDKKKNNSTGSSRTSMVLSSADEQSQGKASKPPQSPWTKGEGNRSEADVKSFLMKAFAPVTNLFKAKPHAHTENVNWMDSSADESDKSKVDALIASEQNPAKMIGLKEGGITLQPTQAKIVIQRVESGEKAWWMDSDNSDQKGKSSPSKISENSCQEPLHQRQNLEMKPTHAKIIIHRVESGEKPWWMSDDSHKSEQDAPPPPGNNSLSVGPSKIRHVPSGELPWWLDEKGEVPEGVVTYPKYEADDAPTDQAMYKVRRNNSADTSWWLTSSEKTTSDSNREPSKNAEQDHWEKYKIRHIDSGERAWWLSSSENISEMVQAKEDDREIQPKYAIRHQDSGEKPWWLHQDVAERNTDDQEVDDQAPLGDRASPEGLEMSKDDEESSDNVSRVQNKSERANQMFISRHTNIDEILGGSIQIWSPQVEKMYEYGNEPDRSWPRADGTIVHTSSYCGNSTAVIPRENIPQEKVSRSDLF